MSGAVCTWNNTHPHEHCLRSVAADRVHSHAARRPLAQAAKALHSRGVVESLVFCCSGQPVGWSTNDACSDRELIHTKSL